MKPCALPEDADVAVLFLALPASIESEGYDRPHLDLTAAANCPHSSSSGHQDKNCCRFEQRCGRGNASVARQMLML